MEYRIADFTIRTHGPLEDLVACGLGGFAPFATEQSQNSAILDLESGCELSLEDFTLEQELYTFNSEVDNTLYHLARTRDGYLNWSENGQKRFIFFKSNDSATCRTNMQPGELFDISVLRFSLWLMFGIAITPLQAIAFHSSVNVKDGKAVLCLGESGTGKSTHTRLWREHIEGTRLLNDDSPIVRVIEGKAIAYGSPWSGKTPCYLQKRYPVAAFLRLSQAPYNKIRRHGILEAIGALLPSCPPAFAFDSRLQDCICSTLSSLISCCPVYHLECLPDKAAAELSYKTIYNIHD